MVIDQIHGSLAANACAGLLVLAWLIVAFRTRPGLVGLLVGLAHLTLAGLIVREPLRALIDPPYGPFVLGMISVSGSSAITAAAAIVATAAVGAFSALHRSREAMLLTLASSLLFLGVLGWPWVHALMGGIQVDLQLGDSLVIPVGLASAAGFAVTAAPFLLGAVWAAVRTLRAPPA
ncbi:MAG: hypothetical protein QE280_04795 [Caulobacter sp.]|jgi:hypothetical protein|nr:hypothetical protein [Caulobacter sp.]